MRKHLSYLEQGVVETWMKGDLLFSIVQHRSGHYCGYVRFPRRPLREKDYHGFVTYVPVHGGITYAEPFSDGSFVYGFDCAHLNDDTDPRTKDMTWLRAECERMALGLQTASKYEKRYLQCLTNKGKARVITEFHKEMGAQGVEFDPSINVGAMLNVLEGRL